jgi:microcystin-dependent protein
MSTHKALLTGVLIAASAGIIGLSPTPAQACDETPLAGAVCWMAGTYCPGSYYLPADGRVVAISEYEALYSLFGVAYGGDGKTTFGLPDLRGRAIAGTGRPNPATSNSPVTLALGQKLGAEAITLNQAMMATHTHAATFTGQGSTVTIQPKIQVVATSPSPGTSLAPSASTPYLAGIPGSGVLSKKMWVAGLGTSTANVGGATLTVTATPAASGGITVTNSMAGGNGTNTPSAVPTISPELVMTACVAVNGIYPVKPNN